MLSQLNVTKFLGTSSSFTNQNTFHKGLLALEYDVSSLFDTCSCKNWTTSFAFCSLAPLASSCSFQMNLLMTTPTPSCEPFPCPLPKKFHVVLQTLITFGYLFTKNKVLCFKIGRHVHRTKPTGMLGCNHSGPCGSKCNLKQCWTNLESCFRSSKISKWYYVRIKESLSNGLGWKLWW
jgi:hypothetical protein